MDRIMENLHKAKTIDKNEWIEGVLLKSDNECRIITSYLSNNDIKEVISAVARLVDRKTICCDTGRFDINGLPIFENSIVKEDTYGNIGIVKFGEHETEYGYYIEWVSEKTEHFRTDLLFWLEEGIEVIGNVFDNQELLK